MIFYYVERESNWGRQKALVLVSMGLGKHHKMLKARFPHVHGLVWDLGI